MKLNYTTLKSKVFFFCLLNINSEFLKFQSNYYGFCLLTHFLMSSPSLITIFFSYQCKHILLLHTQTHTHTDGNKTIATNPESAPGDVTQHFNCKIIILKFFSKVSCFELIQQEKKYLSLPKHFGDFISFPRNL